MPNVVRSTIGYHNNSRASNCQPLEQHWSKCENLFVDFNSGKQVLEEHIIYSYRKNYRSEKSTDYTSVLCENEWFTSGDCYVSIVDEDSRARSRDFQPFM